MTVMKKMMKVFAQEVNMKKWIIIASIILSLIVIFLIIYPTIEIQTEDQLIAFRYSDDIDEFESDITDDECYVYYDKRDISLFNYDFQKFWFFHVITMDYVEGNMCEKEYVLEEEYIQNFIDNATIEENEANLDIAELIKDKKAIVGNTRYSGNEYDTSISYVLDGEQEILYVFYSDDLLVIQVGSSDEGPKFIAYK